MKSDKVKKERIGLWVLDFTYRWQEVKGTIYESESK